MPQTDVAEAAKQTPDPPGFVVMVDAELSHIKRVANGAAPRLFFHEKSVVLGLNSIFVVRAGVVLAVAGFAVPPTATLASSIGVKIIDIFYFPAFRTELNSIQMDALLYYFIGQKTFTNIPKIAVPEAMRKFMCPRSWSLLESSTAVSLFSPDIARSSMRATCSFKAEKFSKTFSWNSLFFIAMVWLGRIQKQRKA